MRMVTWNLGWLLLAFSWLGPLPRWAESSFAAHMTLHMLIVAIVAPMLSIAMAGLYYDPVRKVPALFSPVLASVGELLIVWAWHAPKLHHWARHDGLGLIVEQGMFLSAGMWVWLSAFGGKQPRSRSRSGAGVVGLLLTSMHMTFLGALLALSPRLLYQHHHGTSGLTPLVDQHLGGAVMLVVGGIAYLAGGLWLTRDLVGGANLQFSDRSELTTTQAQSIHSKVIP